MKWTKLRSVAVLLCCVFSISGIHFVAATRQNPLKDPRICGRPECEVETQKFAYADTHRYKYDYTMHVRSEFAGTGENTSDLYLKATIDLIFPKKCEGVLMLSGVELREKIPDESAAAKPSFDYYDYGNAGGDGDEDAAAESDLHAKSSELAAELQKHDLRFAFHDGLIGEVCAGAEEPSWVLNMKKGILSAVQNTMLRFDVDFNTTETDVSGTCNIGYTLEGTNDIYVLIKKTKDIPSCRDRYKTHSFLQTTPYTFREDKSIWPILNSESYCNLTIDHNVYREISCYERHQLIPFSNSSTGAVTETRAKLVLQSEETYNSGDFIAYEDENEINHRSSLLFDHTPAQKPTHGEIRASRDLLKQMCNVGFPNIQREFIDVFTNFLQTSKYLDYKALTQLLARSGSICSYGKNHVLESLPYIKSTASYQLMRDQIISNSIPKLMAHNWMTSLSFITRPDEETLETFYTILEYSQKRIDPEYTLGATAVIHNFCKHNSNCEEHEIVQKIVSLLETEYLDLLKGYKNDRRTRDRLVVILKGLGNIGVMSVQFEKALQNFINTESSLTEIRLQAVLAFRRTDCVKSRDFFLNVYQNKTISSEIRIFSYLQAMRCPNYQSINLIKDVLREEDVNQVGSYVWSHLKNVAKSSSPVRVEAQGLLVNDDLEDKFRMDFRKFSRNYEHSLFFDEYNFGSTTDANIIFGTDSYLPRIATLNFTTDLFGESINFFEISTRAQGFEQLITSAFGPKGPFNRELFRNKFSFLNNFFGDESAEEDEDLLKLDNFRLKRESIPSNEDYVFEDDSEGEHHSRPTRSTHEDRKSTLYNDIDNLGYKLNHNYNDPRATIGLRIFGNDLRYYSIDGMLEVLAASKEFDPYQQAVKILSGQEIVYTKNRVFLDASYNVPLSCGLPLSIHAFGASSVDLRISGDLKRIGHPSEWHLDVNGKIKPSISVDVISTMQSDLFYALSGIRVKSNLYSSSTVEAKIKVRGSSLVSCTLSLPQDKNEIFSARSELIVMKENREIPQIGIERRTSNTTCTWPALGKAVGLQVCSYFSVPDLSNAPAGTEYPGLLLSGPVNISLVLEKSDLTAKKFVFEYKSLQIQNDSKWSFTFHTPDSAKKRILTANVTSIPDALNASMVFVSEDNTYSAVGQYVGNPNDRKLVMYLETNGQKNIDLNMQMPRKQVMTAWLYKPKVILAINGDNITGLVGTVKITEKNGISQSDIELAFETKRLQAMIKGNIVQNEVTTSTNMTVNYRFQANKIENIKFEGKISNVGDKSKTEYRGDVKLRTTAYPKMNFVSNATWLSLQGHTEGKLTYNNAPDLKDPKHTSAVRLVFARAESDDPFWEGSRTKASVELLIPQAKVDFRILVKHEERNKNGTVHDVLTAFRYAPQKEATGVFSVHFPRRNLFAIDSYVNISVPEFDSCTVKLKIFEKTQKDYFVDFDGNWFSGHNITVKGNFKDKSTRLRRMYKLKMIADSPSFETTSVNAVYNRNELGLLVDVQAKYSKDPYRLRLETAKDPSKKSSNSEIRFNIKDKNYWITSNMTSNEQKLLQVEIHLDKIRDIHMKFAGLSLPKKKEVSVELKWDANRDPSQRLAVLAEYKVVAYKTYDGNLMLTYPEKTFSCGFNTYTGGPVYNGSARASWSSNDLILFTYDAGFLPGDHFDNWIRAELLTPFDGWRKNSMEGGVYLADNLILVNSSLRWADDQNLALAYKSDYEVKEPLLSFDVRLGINSTIQDIPTISAKVKHYQDLRKINSDVGLRFIGYNHTLNVYSVKSDWEFSDDGNFSNMSGTVLLVSPFDGYKKGGLATKFSLSDNRQIQGGATLNFEKKEFTLAVEGYVKKFTDNLLEINITTPLEKFRTIKGRFGLNEKNRHAVAEVRAPTVALGAEVLFQVNTFTDFDVKFSLATPLDAFKQVALVAKVKIHTVDLRGSWNNATLGFTGVWRVDNQTDFEYSYKIFTPLQHFEENGFVLKLVHKDIFILEVHGKLSTHKLGIKVNGQPKSNLIKQLGSNKLDIELLYDDDLQPPSVDEDYSEDEEEINYDDFFAYFADFQVDTLVWPTITGFADVQEIRDFYIIVSDINLPQGKIDIKDRVYYPDMLNVKNVLNVNTPFAIAREVKSIFAYDVDLGKDKKLITELGFIVKNIASRVTEVGYFVNYTTWSELTDGKVHDLALTLKTPFELMPKIDVTASLELEDNLYKANIESKTAHTHLSLSGSLETEENFLETSVGIMLDTSVIPHYGCKLYFKKDLSQVDNYINLEFEIHDNGTNNKLQIETGWHLDTNNYINAKGKVQTNMLPLKMAESSILLAKGPNSLFNFDLTLLSRTGHRMEYGVKANKKRDVVDVEIWTPLPNYRNISLHGTLIKQGKPNEYVLNGVLYRNLAVYTVKGVIVFASFYPEQARLRVQPNAGGPDGVIEFSIKDGGDEFGKSFEFSAIEDRKMCTISGGYSMKSHLDWDMSVLVQSTEESLSRVNLNAKLQPERDGKFITDFNLESPWTQLGLERIRVGSDVDIGPEAGGMRGEYDLGSVTGKASCTWTWVLFKDMQLHLESLTERVGFNPRVVRTSARYINPDRSFQRMLVGGKLNVDSKWILDVNGTVNFISSEDVQAGLVAHLPEPVGDIHHIGFRFRGNPFAKKEMDVIFEGKYNSEEAKRKYLTKGSFRNVDDLQGIGRIEYGLMDALDVIEGNFQMLRKREVRKEFYAKVITPYYKTEDSFFMSGFYDLEQDYHKFVCSVNAPSSRRLAETDVKFASLSNIEGFLNSTTPFLNVTWLKADFNFSTAGGESVRYLKGTWPRDSAFFHLYSTYTSQNLNRDLQGTIKMEVPLTQRHRANIDYGLKERQLLNTGHANVIYNDQKVLNGQYNCKSEERAGFEKDVVDISLENDFKPLGVRYIHVKQYSGAEYMDYDMKHTEVYELRNTQKFNLTGEFHVRTTETGQQFKIVAVHPNRTVILNSEYDQQDYTSRQMSKLQVAPNAWIGYNVQIGNKTTETNETQNFAVELFYPQRNLSAEGYYSMTEDIFDSDIAFKWTISPYEEKKTVRAGFLWKTEAMGPSDRDNQSVVLTLGHPSLDKDATLRGLLYRGAVDLLKVTVVADYSDDPDHMLEMHTKLSNRSTHLGQSNYTLDLFVQHKASELELDVRGAAIAKPSYYKTDGQAVYKRGFFPEKKGMFLGKIDLNKKELEYERQTPYRAVRVWALPHKAHPIYGINATLWDSPSFNHSGFMYVDFDQKYTRMEVNLTEDASQNLQMIGYIPDARSAYLDVWRNYEEIRIIDIASYVRMNHSRLVTGQFHWRPKIKSEIKDKIKSLGTAVYTSFSDGIDFWIKSLYSETFESVNEIWGNSKIHTQSFLDDISELGVLEQDIDDLRLFMNSSYEANDFYIKTVVNFTLTVLDELAIRDHIESLPQIFTELWQSMGDSGKALRKSIMWLIETIKTTYNKALEDISRFFHGESLKYLSALMEKGVEKYDRFVKDLHISFIKYVENLWNKFWMMCSNYWKSVLKRIQPHIYKFAHYVESAAWNISKEVFDFIYKRTNELASSPYFNKVSSFTQDLDRLIKDIEANDAITNFKKYSVIAWSFVKEKYFKLVPFGKELNDIFTEIWEEVKTLQEPEHVQMFMQKWKELEAKLEWVAEELQFEKRLHQLWAIVRNKLRRFAMTALQTDDMYREAKTKFIFDPETGRVDLEQKLPMSWHAFNETPKFEEIPEYKMISDVQTFFARTNSSIVAYAYGLRTHLDTKTWLPPFTGHSLLIGSRHYMTFDKKFVGLNLKYEDINGQRADQCSYVLAHDFFLKNFTLLLEPSAVYKNGRTISTRKFTLMTNKAYVEIDVTGDNLTVGDNHSPILPIKSGDLTISRDSDILTIESEKEFVMHCNLQFDLCWMEVGGWYFGQNAGVLGTMNNEIYDDFTTASGHIENNPVSFVNSWGLKGCEQSSEKVKPEPSPALVELCSEFLKTAHFSSCRDTLDPTPFYEMCLDMGSNSLSTVLNDNHPAMKGACTAALGYIEACAASHIPLRIPVQCVHCNLLNGSYVPEGTFLTVQDQAVPKSSDIVFIVEAKSCNAELKSKMIVAEAIEEELHAAGLVDNRYAVLAFGGRAPFDKPRSVVSGNNVFTSNVTELAEYFDHIEIANGTNNDIFQAISAASKLIFRPGVSKTFVLVPCSHCSTKNMKYDYSSLLQFILEEGINLHILSDVEFEFEKTRKMRHFFGMDREFAFSKRHPDGNADLRKQIHMSKDTMGLCIPLAWETNGSVFSSRRLTATKALPGKKVASIFAKRVAASAMPNHCQVCECAGHNTGVAYMTCSPCSVTVPADDDYDFDMIETEFNNWDLEDEER